MAKPMEMEWVRDGRSGELLIVQARPETVHSQRAAGVMKSYRLREKGERLISGQSVGEGIAAGKVCRLRHLLIAPESSLRRTPSFTAL